jgi:hypothetical protein
VSFARPEPQARPLPAVTDSLEKAVLAEPVSGSWDPFLETIVEPPKSSESANLGIHRLCVRPSQSRRQTLDFPAR